jgi:hypothetical protein
VFSYSSSFKYVADSVAISTGIAVLLISRIHLRRKKPWNLVYQEYFKC